jgi:hypothetical protein
MCKVSLVGFAVGGAFLNLAYWDMPYYLMVALVASHRLVKERLVELPDNQPFKARKKPARAMKRTNLR